jgi:hypothetical protein
VVSKVEIRRLRQEQVAEKRRRREEKQQAFEALPDFNGAEHPNTLGTEAGWNSKGWLIVEPPLARCGADPLYEHPKRFWESQDFSIRRW